METIIVSRRVALARELIFSMDVVSDRAVCHNTWEPRCSNSIKGLLTDSLKSGKVTT